MKKNDEIKKGIDSLLGNQVVILCGGRGIRLKPTTDEIPKVLVELNGRAVLDYILDFYQLRKFSRFILCIGYKGDKIKDHYSIPSAGVEMTFSDAGEEASMLERIWVLHEIIDERFFVSYGDTLIDLDIDKMVELHLNRQAEITMVTAGIRNPFGLVTFDAEGWVTSFVEKPTFNYYIGNFLMERSALKYITPEMLKKPDGEGLVDLFLSLLSHKKLVVFEHTGAQITFNTEDERRQAEDKLGRFYTFAERGEDSSPKS